MRVVGLDLSLTATGVASIGDHGWDAIETIKTPKDKIDGHDRLLRITNGVLGHCLGADLVLVEGPSFGSKGNALHQIGGLWWLVTHRLWQSGIETKIASPAQVKMYATGKGTADKDAVVIAVTKRYPNVEVGNNNEADALLLAAMGKRLLGEPVEASLPETHLRAMDKIREEAA